MNRNEEDKGYLMPHTSLLDESTLRSIMLYFPKALGAVMGAVFSLMLSGDIGRDGKIKISMMVIVKFAIAITISLLGGESAIYHFGLQELPVMTHGFVMLITAVFGMLAIGIVYQSIELMKGKKLSEIINEIRDAFFAIFGK